VLAFLLLDESDPTFGCAPYVVVVMFAVHPVVFPEQSCDTCSFALMPDRSIFVGYKVFIVQLAIFLA